MAAQYRIDVGTFTGTGGSLQAKAFLRKVDNAAQAGEVEGPRMAGIVKNALKGTAEKWLENQISLGTAGLDNWNTLRPLMVTKFCKRLTVAELAALEDTLTHKAGERVEDFFTRCESFVLEQDADLADQVRQQAIYQAQRSRKIKFAFLKGLREDVRRAMAGVDVMAVDNAALLEAANNAEILCLKKSDVHGESSKPEVDELFSETPEGRQFVAYMDQRYSRGGGGRGGARGRSNFRGRGGRNNNRGGGTPRRFVKDMTPEEARARGLNFCRRHQAWGGHAESDCRAMHLPIGPFYNSAGRGATGGGWNNRGRGGANRRSYANAAGASTDPANEFQPWTYEEAPASGNA
jgi:hypothetical protein